MNLRIFDFYQGKKVLVTGNTGFKGTWLCRILQMAGAQVTGYALEAPTAPSLFSLCRMEQESSWIRGDVRDLEHLQKTMEETQPELVFHLAAQPIVRESYERPVYTYETNVMGTVHVLESVRNCPSVRSFLNVTTDKVYQNREWEWGYRENDPLDGFDPYSNSKSCSELVTHSYRDSFFAGKEVAASTARAGNVIGGGDFARDRIVPDCVRAAQKGEPVMLRNPHSVRPFQHVLEPLFAYLLIGAAQYEQPALAGAYNVGPEDRDCITAGELAALFCENWGQGQTWECTESNGPHEANFLKLDCSRMKQVFGWKPVWDVREAVARTVEWSKAWQEGQDMAQVTDRQIRDYERDWEEMRKAVLR